MGALWMTVGTFTVAVLVAGGTATRAVSRLWLRHWIEHRATTSRAMSRYLERPVRLTHAASTGVSVTVFATAALITLSHPAVGWALGRDALVYLTLLVVIGQMLARAVGRRWATQLVPVLVPVLRLIDLVVAPVQGAARGIARRLVPKGVPSDDADSLEELEDLLRDGTLEGIGTTEEMAIISGVVQFGEKSVADVMTPRAELFALDEALPPDALAREVALAGYSRVPLYRGTPDHVVGMLHAFDVFKAAGARTPGVRPVTFTTVTQPANELLFDLLRSRRQLAIVRDTDGRVAGLVTLEDLLEELVGDIRDEHDEPAPRGPGGAT